MTHSSSIDISAPRWDNVMAESAAFNPSSPELATLWGEWDSYNTAGVAVSERTSLTLSAFFSGITLISDAMASMPINVYRPLKSGSLQKRDDHPVHWCFNRTPNGWITPSVSRAQIQAQQLLSGNSVSAITRNGRGQGVEYKTFHPVNTRFYVNTDGRPSYGLRDYPLSGSEDLLYSKSPPSAAYEEYDADEVLHFKAFSVNGYTGLSVLKQARESLGLGLTIEQFGQKFFTKGRPAGFLTKEGKISQTASDTVKAEWKEFQEGVRNAFNIGILSGGWAWQGMGYTNDDAQFLQSRAFQVLEVARWLRIPPHMLAELGKATNSNIESLMLEFILYTLMPWMIKNEEEINLKMFTPSEQAMGFRAIYDVDAWLRGDSKTRATVNEMNIRNGVKTIKEIRDKELLPEYEDDLGKEPLIIASQLDTLANVMAGTSKLQGGQPSPSPAKV
jgi:HK97 family phage portal protein